MIEKHYGDARVDAQRFDERIGELEPPTRNLSGTLPGASNASLPSKVKEPFVFYGVPTRAGDRGRTGDVQLGNLSAHASKTRTAARISRTWLRCACPAVPSHAPTYCHRNCHRGATSRVVIQ
jgi:hypothetical protein